MEGRINNSRDFCVSADSLEDVISTALGMTGGDIDLYIYQTPHDKEPIKVYRIRN